MDGRFGGWLACFCFGVSGHHGAPDILLYSRCMSHYLFPFFFGSALKMGLSGGSFGSGGLRGVGGYHILFGEREVFWQVTTTHTKCCPRDDRVDTDGREGNILDFGAHDDEESEQSYTDVHTLDLRCLSYYLHTYLQLSKPNHVLFVRATRSGAQTLDSLFRFDIRCELSCLCLLFILLSTWSLLPSSTAPPSPPNTVIYSGTEQENGHHGIIIIMILLLLIPTATHHTSSTRLFQDD